MRERKLQPFVGSYAKWWQTRHEEGEDRRTSALSLHSRKDAA